MESGDLEHFEALTDQARNVMEKNSWIRDSFVERDS